MTTKLCPVCKEEKAIFNEAGICQFHKQPRNKDGYDMCRLCHNEAHRKYNLKRKDKMREYNRAYSTANPDKVKHWQRLNRERHLEARMWSDAKARAERRGVPFTITAQDIVIPGVCPVLGIALSIGRGNAQDHSPSLDAIIPALGYVPGNIAVISHRANSIKNNATVVELKLVTEWLERITSQRSSQPVDKAA